MLNFWPNLKSLTRREVFLKNCRISPIQLTLWNQRPTIKLPIRIHYHIVIDTCCVNTNFGSTDQRSHFCGQRFAWKKIKTFGQNFFQIFSMLSNGQNWLFYCTCALNGWPAGRTEHIFRTHTIRSSIDVSLQFVDCPIPEERTVPWFQKKIHFYKSFT